MGGEARELAEQLTLIAGVGAQLVELLKDAIAAAQARQDTLFVWVRGNVAVAPERLAACQTPASVEMHRLVRHNVHARVHVEDLFMTERELVRLNVGRSPGAEAQQIVWVVDHAHALARRRGNEAPHRVAI